MLTHFFNQTRYQPGQFLAPGLGKLSGVGMRCKSFKKPHHKSCILVTGNRDIFTIKLGICDTVPYLFQFLAAAVFVFVIGLYQKPGEMFMHNTLDPGQFRIKCIFIIISHGQGKDLSLDRIFGDVVGLPVLVRLEPVFHKPKKMIGVFEFITHFFIDAFFFHQCI